MIQLYGRRNSINVQKVSWALCELNLEFTWHDEHGKFGTVNVENYEKLNPQLIVPTLDHNGTIINLFKIKTRVVSCFLLPLQRQNHPLSHLRQNLKPTL